MHAFLTSYSTVNTFKSPVFKSHVIMDKFKPRYFSPEDYIHYHISGFDFEVKTKEHCKYLLLIKHVKCYTCNYSLLLIYVYTVYTCSLSDISCDPAQGNNFV